jgi:hypothetical protein
MEKRRNWYRILSKKHKRMWLYKTMLKSVFENLSAELEAGLKY